MRRSRVLIYVFLSTISNLVIIRWIRIITISLFIAYRKTGIDIWCRSKRIWSNDCILKIIWDTLGTELLWNWTIKKETSRNMLLPRFFDLYCNTPDKHKQNMDYSFYVENKELMLLTTYPIGELLLIAEVWLWIICNVGNNDWTLIFAFAFSIYLSHTTRRWSRRPIPAIGRTTLKSIRRKILIQTGTRIKDKFTKFVLS